MTLISDHDFSYRCISATTGMGVCFDESRKCDGVKNCYRGSDETSCHTTVGESTSCFLIPTVLLLTFFPFPSTFPFAILPSISFFLSFIFPLQVL